MIDYLFYGLIGLVLLTIGVFLAVRVGTWAYLKSRKDFEDSNNHNQTKGERDEQT